MLLESHPSLAALKCCRGFTPAELLWKRYVEPDDYRSDEVKMHEQLVHEKQWNNESKDDHHDCEELGSATSRRQARAMRGLQDNQELQEFWEIMTVFISAARLGTTSAESPSPVATKKRMVYDAVLLGCRLLFLRFAAALYPEAFLDRDELSRRVPLHMAAAQGSKHILQTVLEFWNLKLYPSETLVDSSLYTLQFKLDMSGRVSWKSWCRRGPIHSPYAIF